MNDLPTTSTMPKSIQLRVSIPNRPNDKGKSLFNRLSKYAKDKGLTEQDIIRFAISQMLDRSGY